MHFKHESKSIFPLILLSIDFSRYSGIGTVVAILVCENGFLEEGDFECRTKLLK